MLTYLPDDSDRCRVKELMTSVRPVAPRKLRDGNQKEEPKPPRLDLGNPLRPHKSLQT
jgi:hypothetical protein